MPAIRNQWLFIGCGVLVLLALVLWFVFRASAPLPVTPVETPTPTESTPPPAPQTQSLGGELYEKANNPLEDKLPEQSVPIGNPINDAYKNPFE